ncbi:ShlB/FhaC/HecB family hemolysin secretion/activation protein [Janthinobacterium aquaticum]|uniref:ShlB/FhaC/HecB family hemolysin secretion/activation protein n=1 Tax=Janthinobacterium sp. FT58W TaxID=2654254 RepID=UPI00186AFACF|nr:ShlB/FhaC/HecB family hemolysin secretion/activation protein [Janthinobacterium sp. FT58W]
MNTRLVHLLAGSALSLVVGAVCAAAVPNDAVSTLPEAPADDGVPRFAISRYEVTGDTLLGPQLLQALSAPYTGPARDFGDIERALEAVQNAYRERGYSMVLVSLPEQELEQGVVRLAVRELTVGKVNISGNRHVDEANVRRALPTLVEGVTPNLPELGQSLKLANENPARKLEVRMSSGETGDSIDAAVLVNDERAWKVSLNVDNSGSGESGKTHAGVVLQHANLWGRDHVLSLQYTTAAEKTDQMGVYGVGYHVPLYALGDSLDFFASYSNVDSGTVSAGIFDLAVSGRGATAGARYNQNFSRQGNYEPKLVYGLDYKAYRNSLQFFGVELGTDVTVHPVSIAYIGAWTLDRGEANLGLTLARNISGGKHGSQADFTLARLGAKAGYSTLRLSASVNQVLGQDWQWRALANGQYTPDALVPGEQFGIGGASTVRGFAEREVANDNGANLNLELYTPSWCGNGYQCRALAFYDAGWVRRNHALPGELTSTAIGSAGLGLRILLNRYANVQLDYAHVVNPGQTARRDGDRLHFRVALSY